MENGKNTAWAWSILRKTGIVVCLIAAAFFGYLAFWQVWTPKHEQAANEMISAKVASLRGNSAEAQEKSVFEEYKALWEQNHDLGGWLWIEGTKIDYPVMYTPQSPEYYLRRAFDASDSISGSLLISEGCTPDSSQIIIYGHNMNNGTMFSDLLHYSDSAYAAEHSVIRFDTLDESREYEVLAAFYSMVYTAADENVFRYYQYTDLSAPQRFDDFVKQAKSAALYDTGVTAECGDRLLTLSTCSSHVEDGRFVVIACCKNK